METSQSIIIENKIFLIRGSKVMVDSDLADLYGVSTKNINRAVDRNTDRFPVDFMFKLTKEEYESLRFQFGTSKIGRGGRRHLPYVFTEHSDQLASVYSVLKQLIDPPIKPSKTIGFNSEDAAQHEAKPCA